VTILPAFNPSSRHKHRTLAIIGLTVFLLGGVAGCAQPQSIPTLASIPTDTPAEPTVLAGTPAPEFNPQSSGTQEPDRRWAEKPVGTDKVTVSFYGDNAGNPCIRYLAAMPGSRGVSKCAPQTDAALLGIQGNETDSAGTVYSIVTGRILKDKVTAVSIEFDDGSNAPAEIKDGGFILVQTGNHRAISAVPIDQFGNLVGGKYTFN
jgi:hypothetical protein